MHLEEKDLELLIPFRDSSRLSSQDQFEILLCRYQYIYGDKCFEMLCRKYGLDAEKNSESSSYYEISAEELYAAWEIEGWTPDYLEQLDIVTQRVYQELYGYLACDMLISGETAIDSICAGCGGMVSKEKEEYKGYVRGCDTIYVMLHGKKIRLSFLSFGTEKNLAGVVKKLSRNHPKAQLSRKNCYLVTGLLNNSRVVVTRPPVSEGWTFYVRKFNTAAAQKMEELLTDKNASLVISLLRILVKGCQNLVITGEQASGKTTLLKSMVRFIDKKYSIRVAESAFETRLGELYPDRNIHTLQEYGDSTLENAIALFKKTDTDVTICGEINEPGTAEAYIQLSQSGGRFTMCTSHHSSTDKLICYMRNALLKNMGFQSEQIATEQVVDAIHFDIHLGVDKTGHRFIEQITEIVKNKQSYSLNQVLLMTGEGYKITGCISSLRRREIKKNYVKWQQEDAAALLQEGGSG